MPKMKTHRGAAKRLRRTASGRWARSRSGKSHILTKKDSKRKRRLRKKTLVSGSDQKRITALLPDR